MPNALVLEKKQQQVAELKEKIAASVTGVIVDYKGITVADDTALRKELRENGVEYFVVKIELKSVKQITYKIRRNFFNKFPPYLYLPIIISIIVWGVLPFHSIMQNRELL